MYNLTAWHNSGMPRPLRTSLACNWHVHIHLLHTARLAAVMPHQIDMCTC